MHMIIKRQIRGKTLWVAAISGLVLATTSSGALKNVGFQMLDQGGTGYAYAPIDAAWAFSANAGVAGWNSPWKCDTLSPDPQGTQFAYLQRVATISQNMTGLATGCTYELRFYEATRTGYPENDLSITLDEGESTQVPIYYSPIVSNSTWALRKTTQFIAEKSEYTLTFRTTNPQGGDGDRVTLIDGVCLALVSHPQFSIVPVFHDGDCGITKFKTYTHKLDFGTGTPGTLINGVQFAAYNNNANNTLNFERTVSSGTLNDHAGNTPSRTSAGGLAELIRDMYFNNALAVDGVTTWTLRGLTPGLTYDARIYVRRWGGDTARVATLVFDPDGAGPISDSTGPIDEDNSNSAGVEGVDIPYYINYRFTAVDQENLVITVTQHNPGYSWHLYGLTCEQVQLTLEKIFPADNAILVARDIDPMMTFTTDIQKGGGSIKIKRSKDDSEVQSFDVNSEAIVVSGAQVTIKCAGDLEYSTGYYIEIDAGAFEDDVGHPCPALTGQDGWKFTTEMECFAIVKITDDEDCGILPSKTYTHKLDFGTGSPGALINGVQFNAYNNEANGTLNFTRTISAGTANEHPGNTPLSVSGNLVQLLQDMLYNGAAPVDARSTWTLSGLTPGMTYDTRIYVRAWEPGLRSLTLTFDPDGAGPIADEVGPINEDNAISAGMAAPTEAYYISYIFTAKAGEDLVITSRQHVQDNSWHLYGITNEAIFSKTTIMMIR